MSPNVKKIIEIAENAGKILQKHFKKKLKVDYKTDKYDPVTNADRECSEYIENELKKLYPSNQVLSEEDKHKNIDFSKKVWLVDPLDGTKAFVNEERDFSVLISLLNERKPVLGVIHTPYSKETVYAVKGKPAYSIKNGESKKIRVSDKKVLKNAKLVLRKNYGRENSFDKELLEKIDKNYDVSYEASTGLMFLKIAKGEADIGIHSSKRVKKWDTAAGHIILKRAGGTISKMNGEKLDYTQKQVNWNTPLILSNKKIPTSFFSKF